MLVTLFSCCQELFLCGKLPPHASWLLPSWCGALSTLCKSRTSLRCFSCLIIYRNRISAAKSYAIVVVLRVLVGASEAFVNAAPLYLSIWYKRDELAIRGAIFFSTSAIAGSFNGLIAFGIEKGLNGAGGMSAWKWIFLIEGKRIHTYFDYTAT